MRWVVVAALVLTTFRDPLLAFRIVGFGILPLLVLQAIWFAHGPVWWIHRRSRGDRDAIRRVMRRVLAVPSLFGGDLKYPLTNTLAQFETAAGHPEEAEQLCRRLMDGPLRKSFRAPLRVVLAQALEAQGRDDAGAAERELAERELAALEGRGWGRARKDLSLLVARAENAEARGQDAEAAELYERAVKTLTRLQRLSRQTLRYHAGVAALNAGQPERARECVQALARTTGILAPMIPGLGQAVTLATGRWGELLIYSETLEHLADDPSAPLADDAAVAALGSAATGRRQLGQIDEARRLVDRARTRWGTREGPLPYAAAGAAAELARESGDTPGALAAVDEARQSLAATPGSPTALGRLAAAYESSRAQALAVDERWTESLAAADEVRRLGGLNLRIRGTADVLAAIALARLGRHDEASTRAAAVREVISAFPEDPRLRSALTGGLGGYEQAMGRPAEAAVLFEASLAGVVERSERPRLLFRLGECHASLGERAKARQCWQEAVGFGPGWLYARRAQEALNAVPSRA
jgi:tetratricopeptide (TPR) repeat protein